MAKKKPTKSRPFDRLALDRFAVRSIRPRIGSGSPAWRFTVTVPLAEILPLQRQIATADDILILQEMLVEHFGGCTRLAGSSGHGLRDANQPNPYPEMNYNAYFCILAAPLPESDAYFRALRDELQDALDEGVILVERQDIWIL